MMKAKKYLKYKHLCCFVQIENKGQTNALCITIYKVIL